MITARGNSGIGPLLTLLMRLDEAIGIHDSEAQALAAAGTDRPQR